MPSDLTNFFHGGEDDAVGVGSSPSCNLVRGDCFSLMRKMADGSVDAVITDPPYSDVTHRGARTITRTRMIKKLVEFSSFDSDQFLELARESVRVAKRWVVMFCDWHHAALLEPAGIPLVRLGVWIKRNATPQLTGDRPATGWEAIAILHRAGRKRWNGGGRVAVWKFDRVNARMHPTQKPLDLVGNLVSLFTDRGETVLDPCMGSGTTGEACLRRGRKFVGMEIDERFFQVAQKWLGRLA